MAKRTVCLLSSALLLVALGSASLSRADSAMDACIDAFIHEHVPKDRALKIRKFGSSSAALAPKRAERITLTAKGARTGTQIAAATCIVSGGSVTLESSAATLAATAP